MKKQDDPQQTKLDPDQTWFILQIETCNCRDFAEICQHCGGLCKILEIAAKNGKGMERSKD